MKFFIVFAVFVACAAAASLSVSSDKDAQVVQQEEEINPDGSWRNLLQINNGIAQSQQGQLVQSKLSNEPSIAVTGEYSYTAPDGQVIRITYKADENGYVAEGDAVPKAL